MAIFESFNRERLIAAVATVALEAVLVYGLIVGLSGTLPAKIESSMKLFDVAPVPPPAPEKVVAHPHRAKATGRAAPPALKAKAAAIIAPPPVVPLQRPPPVLASLTAGPGADAHAGSAPTPGPGSGAGGQGNGTGSGATGDGDGDGGTPSVLIGGRLRDSDYPRAAYAAGIGGTVSIRFIVGVNGRVTACRVEQSSGNADLDEATCRLIMQRHRYRAATDASGRKVPEVWTGDHVWAVRRDARMIEPHDVPDAPDDILGPG